MNTTGVHNLQELNQRLAGCSRVPRRGVFAKLGAALQEQRGEAIRREILEIEQWLASRLNLMNYQGPGSKEHEMRQRLASLRAELARLEQPPCRCAQPTVGEGCRVTMPGQILDLRL